jgi:hypothetical protein
VLLLSRHRKQHCDEAETCLCLLNRLVVWCQSSRELCETKTGCGRNDRKPDPSRLVVPDIRTIIPNKN